MSNYYRVAQRKDGIFCIYLDKWDVVIAEIVTRNPVEIQQLKQLVEKPLPLKKRRVAAKDKP